MADVLDEKYLTPRKPEEPEDDVSLLDIAQQAIQAIREIPEPETVFDSNYVYNPEIEAVYSSSPLGVLDSTFNLFTPAQRQYSRIVDDHYSASTEEEQEPVYGTHSISDAFAAHVRQNSITRNLKIWWKTTSFFDNPNYDVQKDINEFLGDSSDSKYYAKATNREQLMQRAEYLIQDKRDRKIIEEGGIAFNLGLSLFASCLDPINLLVMLGTGGYAKTALSSMKFASPLVRNMISSGIACGAYGSVSNASRALAFNDKTAEDFAYDFSADTLSGMILFGGITGTSKILSPAKQKLKEGIKSVLSPVIKRAYNWSTGEEVTVTENGIIKRTAKKIVRGLLAPNLTTRCMMSDDAFIRDIVGPRFSSSTILNPLETQSMPELMMDTRLKQSRIILDAQNVINNRISELRSSGLTDSDIADVISQEVLGSFKAYAMGKTDQLPIKGLADYLKETEVLAAKYGVKHVQLEDEGIQAKGKRVLTSEEIDLPDEQFEQLKQEHFQYVNAVKDFADILNKKEITPIDVTEDIKNIIKHFDYKLPHDTETRSKNISAELDKLSKKIMTDIDFKEFNYASNNKGVQQLFSNKLKLEHTYNKLEKLKEKIDSYKVKKLQPFKADAIEKIESIQSNIREKYNRLEAFKSTPEDTLSAAKLNLQKTAKDKKIMDFLMRDFGINIDTADNYLKRIWNKDKLLADMPKVIKALKRSLLINNKNMTEEQAKQTAFRMFADMTGLNVDQLDPAINPITDISWKSRIVALTDDFTLSYMEPMDVLRATINKMQKIRTEAFLNKLAKESGYSTYKNMLDKYSNKYNTLLMEKLYKNKSISEDELTQAKNNYNILQDIYNAYVGKYTKNGDLANHKILKFLFVDSKFLRYATMLGSLAIATIIDLAVPIFRFGFSKVAKRYITPDFGEIKNNTTNAWLKSFVDLAQDNVRILAEGIDTDINQSLVSKIGKKAMEKMYKYTGAEFLDNTIRKTSLQLYYNEIINYSLKKFPLEGKAIALDKFEEALIKETGLNDSQLKTIRDAYIRHGSDPHGVKYVDLAQIDPELANRLGVRLRLIVDQIVQTPTESSVPIWLQTDYGKAIHQFMSWGFLNYTNLILPMVKGKFRTTHAVEGVAASILLSMFKNHLSDSMNNRDTDVQSFDFWKKVISDSSVATHVVSFAEKGYNAISSHRSPADELFPANSYLTRIRNVIRSIIYPDRNVDWRGLRDSLPFSSAWPVKVITNPLL